MIKLLGDPLQTRFAVSRGQHGKIQREKGVAVIPSQGQHSEALDEAVFGMVVELGQELNAARVLSIVRGDVQNQNFATFLAGEHADCPPEHSREQQEEKTPVGLLIAGQVIGGVFAKTELVGKHDAMVKVGPDEGQLENCPDDGGWRCPAHLADATAVQQCPNGAVVKELIDFRHQSRTVLLRNRDWCNLHMALPP